MTDETVIDVPELYRLSTALDDARIDYEQARDKFLRKAGWKYTSTTPGCYWQWEKRLSDGRVVLASDDFAVVIQRNLLPDLPEDEDGE